MASRVHQYVRMRAVQLHCLNVSKCSIHRILQGEGFKVSYNTVRAVVRRYVASGSYEYRKPVGRPSRIGPFIEHYIDSLLENNNEITAPKIQKYVLMRYRRTLSLATIKRVRRGLGWVYATAKYCQFIREGNKLLRMQFASAALDFGWLFHNVVFTDECTVVLDRHSRKGFMRTTDARISLLKPRVKHPVQVHVWAGISWYGATRICIFDGKIRMNAPLFCRILKEYYLPFHEQYRSRTGGSPVLQMDNDPKHTSAFAKSWMARNGVVTMQWPAESPDLNPIELVWHQLKHYLRRKKPTDKASLIELIKRFWKKYMTEQLCRKYIQHIQTVLPLVRERKGGPSGY
jgi:transposase